MRDWLSITLQIIPVAVVFVVYFVRMETRLTKITTDLCWVKKQLSRRGTDKRESEDVDANNSRP
jgi:hypothetical protein